MQPRPLADALLRMSNSSVPTLVETTQRAGSSGLVRLGERSDTAKGKQRSNTGGASVKLGASHMTHEPLTVPQINMSLAVEGIGIVGSFWGAFMV